MPKAPVSSSVLRNLIYRKAWDKIEQACWSSPLQIKAVDRLGDLPLHEACLQSAPLYVIKHLLKAYPAGAKTKGFCGRLPLHYASYNKPNPKVIKLLLKNYLKGASMKDSDGRLPVHLAVVRNAPQEVIQILISAFPESLVMYNNFGSTPQMLAQSDNALSAFERHHVRDVQTAPARTRSKKKVKREEVSVGKLNIDNRPIDNALKSTQ